MTKSHLLLKLGRDSSYMDFELFGAARSPGDFGGKPYDRAYMGFDFVGYSKARDVYLLIDSWHVEEERLFEIPKGGRIERPQPLEVSSGLAA